MNKESVQSIKQYILNTIKRGGSGYYAILRVDNSVLDIYQIMLHQGEIQIMIIGVAYAASPFYLADAIYKDSTVLDFVYLNDILLSQYRDIPDNM